MLWTVLIFLLGLLSGVVFVVAGVWYSLSFFFIDPQGKGAEGGPPPTEPTSATFQLPPIQNVDVGQNFPVLNWIKTAKVELHPVFKNISTLDILVDLDYAGGFQFSIQAETHLKHSAFLSIQFNGVKGQARMQFTTEPYAHWSFSFAENPDVDISVVSQLYGKSFSHITSIIASQLKRSVRKKHTLPMYKIRYKPFFSRVESMIIAALVPNSAPCVGVRGSLTVTLIECRGLMSNLLDGKIYSTLGLSDFDWVAAYVDGSSTISIVRDLVYVKSARREANLDFSLGMANDVPIVESLFSKSESTTKQHLEFEVGDEILAVDGRKVNSVKQCIKNFKNSTSMKVVWRIRRKHFPTVLPKLEEILTPEELPSPVKQFTPFLDEGTPSAKINRHSNAANVLNSESVAISSSILHLPLTSDVAATSSIKSDSVEIPTHHAMNPLNVPTTSTASRPTSITQDNETCKTGYSAGYSESEPTSPGSDSRERTSGYGFRHSLQDTRQYRVLRTADLPCCKDPIFAESFTLKVEDSNRFLNLGVWSSKGNTSEENENNHTSCSSPSSSPSKRSKSVLLSLESITFNNDRLIGTLSLPLADVIAECSTTGMGYFVKDYYLRSPDGVANDVKEHPLMAHSGFEPQMCFGKISISFLFKPEEDASKGKDSTDSISSTCPTIELATEALSDTNLSPSDDCQSHQFVRTNFPVASVCDYCNKKIWLKEAFACRICFMKCHKKCNDRCIANTICRGEAFYPSIPYLRTTGTSTAPEIITTGAGEPEDLLQEDGTRDFGGISNSSAAMMPPNNGVRRRTLGLLVSAVQSRSAQLNLRRAGSASNLLSPNVNANSSSKSLPPSPQASPSTSRKASQAQDLNPFDVLNAEGFGSTEEDISAAVDHLIQNSNDDLIALAKETGKDVYSDLSLPERKLKLNHVDIPKML